MWYQPKIGPPWSQSTQQPMVARKPGEARGVFQGVAGLLITFCRALERFGVLCSAYPPVCTILERILRQRVSSKQEPVSMLRTVYYINLALQE